MQQDTATPPPQQGNFPPPPPPVTTDDFLKEQSLGNEEPPITDGDKVQEPEQPPTFTEEPAIDPATGKPGVKKTMTNAEKGMKLEIFIQGEEWLWGKLMVKIAREKGTEQKYMMDEEQIQTLKTLLEPYGDAILQNIPPWVWILVYILFVKADQVVTAIQNGKVNKRNEKLKKSREVKETMSAAEKADTGERVNFVITKSGYYRNSRDGRTYMKVDDPKREKADLKDIKKIAEANPIGIIKTAFNLQDEDITNMGIEQ